MRIVRNDSVFVAVESPARGLIAGAALLLAGAGILLPGFLEAFAITRADSEGFQVIGAACVLVGLALALIARGWRVEADGRQIVVKSRSLVSRSARSAAIQDVERVVEQGVSTKTGGFADEITVFLKSDAPIQIRVQVSGMAVGSVPVGMMENRQDIGRALAEFLKVPFDRPEVARVEAIKDEASQEEFGK